MRTDEARWLRLEPQPGETLRSALERTLRDAIRGGVLRPGVRLPSSRALAAQLGISRGVASDAYEQLCAQGFLRNRVKAAPVVGAVDRPSQSVARRAAPRSVRFDLMPGIPDVSLFPVRSWAQVLVRAAEASPSSALSYGSPRGELELREALADHLGSTRGVVTDPDRIIVLSGTAQGAHVLAHALVSTGAHRIAVEDPSWDTQVGRLRLGGLEVIGQPVDGDGLVVDGLAADAVLVAPAHQFPTGTVLSGSRRRQLLAWARAHDALVIEDDYDAEFRYDQVPAPSLQGSDPERVAYLGTASKTLAPGLRLAWLAAPPWLADEAERIKHLLDFCSPVLDQLGLALFLRRGDYDRHVRRVRTVYRRRRDALAQALHAHLPGLVLEGVAAGLHVLLRLPADADDRAIAAAAESEGVRVAPLSAFSISGRAQPGIVIGYGQVPARDLDDAVAALARAVMKGVR
jgi:GntR family transcriptional regulator/MocR family aminotransferase